MHLESVMALSELMGQYQMSSHLSSEVHYDRLELIHVQSQ
jgi:hypothetical protein